MFYKNRQFNIPNGIFTLKDVMANNPSFSQARVFQLLKLRITNGNLVRIKNGIYKSTFSDKAPINSHTTFDIIRMKYINNDENVFGFISGIYLQNMFGLTTQVPNTLEITTNNESTRGRYVFYDNQKFYLKKSKFLINASNLKTLQLISMLSSIDISNYQSNLATIKQYIKDNKIKRSTIISYIDHLSKKAIKNLLYLGI